VSAVTETDAGQARGATRSSWPGAARQPPARPARHLRRRHDRRRRALSGGHLLIEDVPGVGKTVLARTLALSLGVELSRVQGHPDLLPSDVTGVSVYQASGNWNSAPARCSPMSCWSTS